MDNVTHSLAGVMMGRLLRDKNKKASSKLSVVGFVAILASNLPDFDSFFLPLLGPERVNYLLHHRGYTHVLLFLPFVALVSVLLTALIYGKGVLRSKVVFFAALLGVGFHIGMDYWNEYGVHPFWPFSKSWIYGDFIFIVEPLLWFSVLPWLMRTSPVAWGRRIFKILYFLMCGLIALAYARGYVNQVNLITLIIFGNASFFLIKTQKQALSTLAVCLVLFLGFSRWTKTYVQSLWLTEFKEPPKALAVSPLPGGLICWKVVAATVSNGQYIARRGSLSLIPSWVDPKSCAMRFLKEATVDFQPVLNFEEIAETAKSTLYWQGEFRASTKAMNDAFSSCTAQAALRFYRMPFFVKKEDHLVIGDLRYDFEKQLGFSELLIQSDTSCPKAVPSWSTAWSQGF